MGSNHCCSKLKDCIANNDVDVFNIISNNPNYSHLSNSNYETPNVSKVKLSKAVIYIQRYWRIYRQKQYVKFNINNTSGNKITDRLVNLNQSNKLINNNIKLTHNAKSKINSDNNDLKDSLAINSKSDSKLIGGNILNIINISDSEAKSNLLLLKDKAVKLGIRIFDNFENSDNEDNNEVYGDESTYNKDNINFNYKDKFFENITKELNIAIVSNLISKLESKISKNIIEKEKIMGVLKIELNELISDELLKQDKLKYLEYQTQEGKFYCGTVLSNNFEKHGLGIFVIDSNTKYVGKFENDKFNGKGRFFNYGDFYEGSFRDDKANGLGKFISNNGEIYLGSWENNQQHGKGEEFYTDGSRYIGYFDKGIKKGKGKFFHSDGSSYDGFFVNNLMHGKGTYRWKDGKVYSGEFMNDKMEGNGVFIWPDKKKYVGQYSKDRKNGLGIFLWPDGKRYEGEWKNGKQHGHGMMITQKEKRYGIWDNGIRLNWITEEDCLELIRKMNYIKFNDIQSVYSISISSTTSSAKKKAQHKKLN